MGGASGLVTAAVVGGAIVAQLTVAPDPPEHDGLAGTSQRAVVGRLTHDARPPQSPPPPVFARARTDPIARRPFYVSMLDAAAQSHSIARYVRGRPAPFGSLLRPTVDASRRCPGLGAPSATTGADGEVLLYAAERTCDTPNASRLVLWASGDGLHFARRGGVRVGRRPLRSAVVVRDDGRFRAWYAAGHVLWYAESRDGLHFRALGGAKGRTRNPTQVVRHGGRWYLFTSTVRGGHQDAAVLTFADPAQPRYSGPRPITKRRSAATRVAASAAAGQRSLVLRSARGVRPGDLLVAAAADQRADAVQVERIRGRTVRLTQPLVAAHRRGDRVDVATAGNVFPSYVCRARDGSWAGIFSTWGAVPAVLFEPSLVYRARSPLGRWHVDRRATAPILGLENLIRSRSVTAAAPLTTGSGVPRCGGAGG